MSDKVEFDRKWFFDYFRQRALNVEALSRANAQPVDTGIHRSFEPDQHVLIAAGLDSLAKHWGRVSGRLKTEPHADRFAEFLIRHGGHASFSKCAVPQLLGRAVREKREAVIPVLRDLMRGFAHGLVRKWTDDPTLDDLLRLIGGSADEMWVRWSLYGHVLYREYRCMWLHEYQQSSRLAPPDYDATTEPRYQNYSTLKTDSAHPEKPPSFVDFKRPYFPKVFLLETYGHVVTSFESECEAAGVCPEIDD